jgi:hypothetical protein
MSDTLEEFNCAYNEKENWAREMGIYGFAEKLERERDEAREALREIWQSGDAFLPHVDSETINRWRKAAGWEY